MTVRRRTLGQTICIICGKGGPGFDSDELAFWTCPECEKGGEAICQEVRTQHEEWNDLADELEARMGNNYAGYVSSDFEEVIRRVLARIRETFVR